MEDIKEIVRQERNIFITGSAGCGKSYTVRKIYKNLKMMGKDVYLTSTTGISALNIGGITVHKFAGLGLAKDNQEILLESVLKNKKKRNRWRSVDVLIIDEVSMMDILFFKKLEYIARGVRLDDRIFGGIQLILCGDFFQLPPINEYLGRRFIFEMKLWSTLNLHIVNLTIPYRQKDMNFVRILNEIRAGKLSDDGYDMLSARVGVELDVNPTILFSKNHEVDSYNKKEYDKLEGDEFILRGRSLYNSKSNFELSMVNSLKSNLLVKDEIKLKVGTEVLLCANLTKTLVNGSKGIVYSFGEDGFPIVKFDDQLERIARYKWTTKDPNSGISVSYEQVPLIYSYAISIHKSQGLSLSSVEVELAANIFSPAMAYVALSRVTSLEGLSLLAFDDDSVYADKKVVAFYADL